jgi:hypothetical protein
VTAPPPVRATASRIRRLAIAGLAAAGLVLGGIAFGHRVGLAGAVPVGSADVAGLISPNLPSVVVDGASINYVGWVTPSSELPGTLYQVVRTSGPAQGSVICNDETVSPGTATTCPDYSVRPSTRYGYTIRALLGVYWRSEATVFARTSALTLQLDLSDSAPASGQPFTVTAVRAVRSDGLTVERSYSGWKTIRWSGLPVSPGGKSAAYPPNDTSRILFHEGVARGPTQSFTSYTEGPNLLVASDVSGTASGTGTATVASGPAVGLSFGQEPLGGVASGEILASSPQVYVIDAYGNIVGSAAEPIRLSLASGGPLEATLSCSGAPEGANTANFGVATYADCRISGPAGAYRLVATSAGLQSTGDSGPLTIGLPGS